MSTVCGNSLGKLPRCSPSRCPVPPPLPCSAPMSLASWAQRGSAASTSGNRGRPWRAVRAHKVEIELEGGLVALDVGPGETILQAALDQGVELSHDCKMGVCMTCPAKLVSGEVDQSAGMLDEGAKAKGYALLCVSEPKSDCRIRVIDEDEIQEQMLCSSENF